MAEVLGVVASGIAVSQIAGQVTKSIFKLKQYWDQVQDAPDEIKYLLREIDSLNLILNHIQSDKATQTTSSIPVDNLCIQQSLQFCKEGADELRGLVDELAGKIDCKRGWRKKVGSVKVVLKKDDIKKLKKRMKHAIQLLQLSYQWHTNAMIQLQPDIIVARMANHISSVSIGSTTPRDQAIPPGQTEYFQNGGSVVQRQYDLWISSPSWVTYLFGQFEYHQRKRMSKGREIHEVNARYKLPEFLVNKVMEFQGYNILSVWRVSIQTYRVVPGDNEFFKAIMSGDLATVRQMLVNRDFFVTDRDDAEKTPLHLAARYGNAEICKELLLAGANVSSQDKHALTPFHAALEWGGRNTFVNRIDAFGVCRLLLDAGATDILMDDLKILQHFNGPLEIMRLLHQQSRTVYKRESPLSPTDRIDVAAELADSLWHNTPRLVDYWLEAEGGTGALASWVDEDGRNFLQIVAESFTWASITVLEEVVFDESMEARMLSQMSALGNRGCTWHSLIRKVILAGCSAFECDRAGWSILFTMLRRLLTTYDNFAVENLESGPKFKLLKIAARQWLECLAESGVDLLRYGEAETAHWKRGNWGYQCSCPVAKLVGGTVCCAQHVSYWEYSRLEFPDLQLPKRGLIMSFSYGPRPEDWVFEFSSPDKAPAKEFWDMVEGQETEICCDYVPPTYAQRTWSDDESSEADSSDDDMSEFEEESDQESAARTMPGSWSQHFED